MAILKPGDADFGNVAKELDELKKDNKIMVAHDAKTLPVETGQRDFPGFEFHWAIVTMGSAHEVQIACHFKKLSRDRMRKLHEYLPGAIYTFFGGVNPAENIEASESILGSEQLQYRSQYDMTLFRVPRLRAKRIVAAITQILEKFPG